MLHLASKSPRRLQLLALLGLEFGVLELDVPEVQGRNEAPEDYVRRVAREKAGAGLLQVVAVPGALVLGADTEVRLDGEVFGKPASRADAARMLARLSGRTHEVVSAVSLVSAGREAQAVSRSRVRFEVLEGARLDQYLGTNEWEGKAGGYAIQGAAQAFITHVEGSPSGVMGLPLHETATLLRGFGALP